MAYFWTGETLRALLLTFGVFALVDGIVLLAMYVHHRSIWGGAAVWLGVISLLIGIYALSFPSITGVLLALAVAIRAFAGGLLELRMAASLRKHIKGEGLLITSGIASIVFAVLLTVVILDNPIFGLLLLVEIMGIYAICLGVILMFLSAKIKTAGRMIAVKTTAKVF